MPQNIEEWQRYRRNQAAEDEAWNARFAPSARARENTAEDGQEVGSR
jgi:hypothetical protein